MAILMPDLTVEVYNADYRVLSRIPWQEAIRLILRGAVYVIDRHSPAVHIHSPSRVTRLTALYGMCTYSRSATDTGNSITSDGLCMCTAGLCRSMT
jgi:hypothetical protein